ncbi:TPA: terminase family protein [Vibrio vulnificus]
MTEKITINDVSNITEHCFERWHRSLYGYQHTIRNNLHHRTRHILKLRICGLSHYFLGEALEQAILTGENQFFITSSENTNIFEHYLSSIAKEFLGIEISGNPFTLSNGAQIHILSDVNLKTSYSGHVYFDEHFFSDCFDKVDKHISAITCLKKFRKTYFSSLSFDTHPAFHFWTGERWRNSSASRNTVEFPNFEDFRDGGRLCPDRQWRYVITIEDAVLCGLPYDINKISAEYNETDFKRLFMCSFDTENKGS